MFVELVSGHSLENPIQLFERWMIGPYNAIRHYSQMNSVVKNEILTQRLSVDFSRVVINYPHSTALPVEPKIMRLTLGGNIFIL